MKILFLEIDGVLNTKRTWIQREFFEDECIASLNHIIKACDPEIVIASEWRRLHAISHLNYLFRKNKIKKEIASCIPSSKEMAKGEEILMWMELNDLVAVEKFAVVDTYLGNLVPYIPKHKIILTTLQQGLTPALAKKVVKCLVKNDA